MTAEKGLEAWHRVVRHMSPEALDEILSEDVVFHSPVVHTPQKGKAITKLYLMAAFNVLPGDGATTKSPSRAGHEKPKGSFQYVREVASGQDAVLEFVTEIDGIVVNGVDMIRWNDAGQIVDFKVMVRPLKAIQKVHAQMGDMLDAMKKGA
jgi:hypothetical protein